MQTNLEMVEQDIVIVAATPPGFWTVHFNIFAAVGQDTHVGVEHGWRCIMAMELLGVAFLDLAGGGINLWRNINTTVKLVAEQEPNQECIVTIETAGQIVTVQVEGETSNTVNWKRSMAMQSVDVFNDDRMPLRWFQNSKSKKSKCLLVRTYLSGQFHWRNHRLNLLWCENLWQVLEYFPYLMWQSCCFHPERDASILLREPVFHRDLTCQHGMRNSLQNWITVHRHRRFGYGLFMLHSAI